MRMLALETTDRLGGAAALEGGNLLAELDLNPIQRSAQSLAPAMRALLETVGWRPDQVELVAVSVGPGSFTGLRVGVTAAKVFAYAVGAEVLGVNTLEAIAANAGEVVARGSTLCVVEDAQRGEVVVQSFVRGAEGDFAPLSPQALLAADAWLARLAAEAVVAGPGLARWGDRLPPGVVMLPRKYWRPRAAVVGQLAARRRAEGRRDDLWKLAPLYYRRSAAEEKWDAGVAT